MKTRYIIATFLLSILALGACDKVSPPFVEEFDYCGGNKKVLVEDYTGHGCVNCPGAAVIAHDLNEELCSEEHKLVIISVHAGYFAEPNFENNPLFAADFTTEAGNTWDAYFGNSSAGNPNGLIDRVKGQTGYVFYPDSWGETAAPLLLEAAKVLITINNDFNKDTRELTTTVTTDVQENIEGVYKVIVCVTQNNIVAPQKNNNPEIGPVGIDTNYVHNHVLRGSLNGAWGENLSPSGVVTSGNSYQKTYKKVFPEAWITKDCQVVAFVYHEESKQVLQAEELAVIEE